MEWANVAAAEQWTKEMDAESSDFFLFTSNLGVSKLQFSCVPHCSMLGYAMLIHCTIAVGSIKMLMLEAVIKAKYCVLNVVYRIGLAFISSKFLKVFFLKSST